MAEVMILVKGKDELTAALKSMSKGSKELGDDLIQLANRADQLSNTKASLKTDLTVARKEIKDANAELSKAKKGTDEFNAALERVNQANADFDNIKLNLKAVEGAASGANKELGRTIASMEKADNRAETSRFGGKGGEDGGGMLAAIAAAGGFKMVGDTIAGTAGTLAGSALGAQASGYIETALSGAASGAAIGSLIAPGVGTAIGAVIGGGLGLINAEVEKFEQVDDIFKNVVNQQYTSALQNRQTQLETGSAISARRETDMLAFQTMMGGQPQAEEFLSGIRDMAARTPFFYDDLTNMSKQLLASGFEADQLSGVLTTLGNAGGTLGMETSDINMLSQQLGYMKQSDKATLQQLRPFLTRGVKAFDYLAEAKGITTDQLLDKISKGDISGREAADIILAGMDRDFEGGMELLAGSYSGISDTVDELKDNLYAAQGEAYQQERKTGLRRERAWLEDSGGEGGVMTEWYSAIGRAQGQYDNTQSQVERGVLRAMSTGETGTLQAAMGGAWTDEIAARMGKHFAEYQEASATGNDADMTRLMGIAESEMANLFQSTDIAAALQEANVGMVDGIQESVAANRDIVTNTMETNNALSQGFASTETGIAVAASNIVGALSAIDFSPQIIVQMGGTPMATGFNYVPYNDFPARLHEGERVLTAQQARAMDQNGSGGGQINISGNTFHVRSESDITAIAQALYSEIQLQRMVT